MSDELRPIIVKRIKKQEAAAHGGAWKVAYADFVTAMMAFFLLMWLLNMTSPEQKRGIADYFAPASVSKSQSGSGGMLGGTAFSDDGARADGQANVAAEATQEHPATDVSASEDAQEAKAKSTGEESQASLEQSTTEYDAKMFNQAEESLRQAMKDMPELAELSKHILIDQTPEGLRIQIVDQEGRPMFAPGSVEPYSRTLHLIKALAIIIDQLPNRITISGHTDSATFYGRDGYSNWELSAGRANATRRILMDEGVDGDRVYMVSGKAGSEPLFPDDPLASANRRISVVLLREAPVMPPQHRP